MTEPFGGEPFRSSLLLVLCNRLLTSAVAASILVVRHVYMNTKHRHTDAYTCCVLLATMRMSAKLST